MQEQIVSHVAFNGRLYGITFSGDRFGVCKNGYGKVKYMPVTYGRNAPFYFPKLFKTRLSMKHSAEELYNNLITCDKIKSSPAECIRICEHVLQFGHTPR
jgi:hypothetical protein